MATLDPSDHVLLADLLHTAIKDLRPLENPEHVEPFNAYRALSAKLAAVLEDDEGTRGLFSPLKFIHYVMRGEAS